MFNFPILMQNQTSYKKKKKQTNSKISECDKKQLLQTIYAIGFKQLIASFVYLKIGRRLSSSLSSFCSHVIRFRQKENKNQTNNKTPV